MRPRRRKAIGDVTHPPAMALYESVSTLHCAGGPERGCATELRAELRPAEEIAGGWDPNEMLFGINDRQPADAMPQHDPRGVSDTVTRPDKRDESLKVHGEILVCGSTPAAEQRPGIIQTGGKSGSTKAIRSMSLGLVGLGSAAPSGC